MLASSKRLGVIDGWRAIACMGVLYIHVMGLLQQPTCFIAGIDVFKVLSIWGNGVHLFFVISGFCFYWVMHGKQQWDIAALIGFWKKRLLRIAPAFYVACMVYALVYFKTINSAVLFKLACNFLFIQPYVHGAEIAGIFWSLSVEWFFYIGLPFVFMAIKKWGYRIMLGPLLLLFILLNLAHYKGLLYNNDFAWYYTIMGNFGHFVWGIIIGRLYQTSKATTWPFKSWVGFIVGLVIAYMGKVFYYSAWVTKMGTFGFLFETIGPLLMTFGFAYMILVSLQHPTIGKIIGNKYLAFVGKISFSFYLWHALLLDVCFGVFQQYLPNGPLQLVSLYILTTLVIIPISYLSYWLLESFYFRLQKS
ncbi:acyltransferase family protein [Ferruginibacter yonginensis]|uniref:Acyltransferase family protein n=1 Tax=Ferruginibacter yonginensis TaxID=1310416 RepID=A0ABV8QMC8_9BACT